MVVAVEALWGVVETLVSLDLTEVWEELTLEAASESGGARRSIRMGVAAPP
jgi:hypothetical protein